MRSIEGSLVGLVLAGILALAPTAAFAHGGGGGFGGATVEAVVLAAATLAAAISLVSATLPVAVTSPGLRGIVQAIASLNIRDRALGGTEVTSDTAAISLLEIPSGMITPTTGMMIRTTGTMMRTASMTKILGIMPIDSTRRPN
jgi:hypothetical protein